MRWLLVLACVTGCESDDATADWQLVAEATPAALLAVAGTTADDVWVVGGRSELDGAPVALHYDGGDWTAREPGVTGVDLWWVFPGPTGDTVYFGGSGGTILRYRGGAFEPMVTPRTGIIFGIWGAADDDLWAVGDGGAGGAILWHFDGTAWSELAIPGAAPSRLFKVHGQATDDVWISGSDGLTLHWQGTTLERVPAPTTAPLFSIVSTATSTIAVGGTAGDGQLHEHVDGSWTRPALASPVPWRGVTARGDAVYAVGESGVVATRTAGTWALVEQPVTQGNFHAAWIDPDGALWGVGGEFARLPLTSNGFLTYFGTRSLPEVP